MRLVNQTNVADSQALQIFKFAADKIPHAGVEVHLRPVHPGSSVATRHNGLLAVAYAEFPTHIRPRARTSNRLLTLDFCHGDFAPFTAEHSDPQREALTVSTPMDGLLWLAAQGFRMLWQLDYDAWSAARGGERPELGSGINRADANDYAYERLHRKLLAKASKPAASARRTKRA